MVEQKFKSYLNSEGIKPYRGNVEGALQDMMWNAGSSPYLSNAVQSGRPIAAFVENASLNRGFSTFELPTALNSPTTVMNGYPMSAFGPDPLTFASRSAAQFQQLETHLAQSASVNSHRSVSVADLRAQVDVSRGYDAVHQTVFGQSVADFSTHDLGQMATISRDWQVARNPSVSLRRTEPEPTARAHVMEAHLSTGPPIDPLTMERGPSMSSIGEAGPGMAARTLGVAGAAAIVYDASITSSRAADLLHEGNRIGAQSQVEHFTGRAAGGLAGGFGAGFAYGALVGSETGPGAIATGLLGGAIGAAGGEKLMDWHDHNKIYNQTDTQGQTWSYNRDQPQQGWTRDLPPLPETPHSQHLRADPALAERLTYQASTTAAELAMGRVGSPVDPYTQPATAKDTPSFGDPPWQRNAQNGQWERQINAPFVERQVTPAPRIEQASPERTRELNAAVQGTIAQNLSASKQGLSEQYQAAYQKNDWRRFGPMPEEISKALHTPATTLEASDGHTYTQGSNGQWTTPGRIYGTNAAQGNLRQELDATRDARAAASAERVAEPAPVAHAPSAFAQEMSAKLDRFEHAMKSGDQAAIMKEVAHVYERPEWKADLGLARDGVARAQIQREQYPRDPRDAAHPDHAMNQSIRSKVETAHEKAGIYLSNKELDHLTAGVANDARKQGMTRVDQVQLDTDQRQLFATQQNGPQDLFAKHSVTNVQQAMQTAPEQAYQQMGQETQRQAQVQQNIQQQIAQSQQQGPSLGR